MSVDVRHLHHQLLCIAQGLNSSRDQFLVFFFFLLECFVLNVFLYGIKFKMTVNPCLQQ